MPRLKMLIGLPGSGKSTFAAKITETETGWIHLSSDRIAHERFSVKEPIDHRTVFEELYQQTAASLTAGRDVIYDATNLASSRRKSLLNRLRKMEAETEAILFFTPVEVLKQRNRMRNDRERVPEAILERYIRALQFPRRDEKLDKISIVSGFKPSIKSSEAQSLRQLIGSENTTFEDILALYRSFEESSALITHPEMEAVAYRSYKLFKQVQLDVLNRQERALLSWAMLLHGIGKPHVRKPVPIEQDNFYGYEHVSMYMAYPILSALEYPEPFVFDVLLLIDEHREAPAMKRGKIRRRIGEENFQRLQFLMAKINT
ncbi:ATP-binding protein [Planococcus liqunii]|uniref:ATP-binding protein n=1 Tax=Planococcus liqunii TaxID=3058394 RepID=UPI002623F236|nr:ATP-binding protein [Planococcus sp. N056]WKA52051.1 ATP-binding protein [Planococcus sp. N056]